MSEENLQDKLIGWLREMPLAYRGTRALFRLASAAPRELLRCVAPVDSRIGPPKGWFSALHDLDRGQLKGNVLFRSQEVPPAGANSMRIMCRLKQEGHQPWPAFWTHHREARLVSESLVLLNTQKHACIEAMYGPMPGFERNPAWRYLGLPQPVRLTGPWTSLVSFLSRHFYHWVYDELPRLIALPEFPADTRILIPADPPAYILETIQLLGLEKRVRPTPERHLIIDDFYFSSPSAMLGCPNPAALRFLRKQFLPHADECYTETKRVYLVRSNKTRGIANAHEVNSFFAERGWAIVDPEELTFAQQIKLFSEAEAVAGLHGGSFTNLIWCRPGCRVFELFANNFLNGCYEGMAACLDLNYRYAIFPADGQYRAQVDLRRLSATLDDF